MSNRGIGNEGLVLEGGQPYEGFFFYKADAPTTVSVGLRDYVASSDPAVYLAHAPIPVNAAADWTRVNFTLTPSAGTNCVGM